jgi:transcription antitermination factor NusG
MKVGRVLKDRGYPFHIYRQTQSFFKYGKNQLRIILTFPRYVFVPIGVCWEVTHVSDDILGPVRFGECVAKVPEGFVETLSLRCKNGDDILVIPQERDNPFRFGQKVMVTGEGHLAGNIGSYVRPGPPGKAFVELSLMGRATTVSLDKSSLIPVDDGAKRKRYGHRTKQLSTSVTN